MFWWYMHMPRVTHPLAKWLYRATRYLNLRELPVTLLIRRKNAEHAALAKQIREEVDREARASLVYLLRALENPGVPGIRTSPEVKIIARTTWIMVAYRKGNMLKVADNMKFLRICIWNTQVLKAFLAEHTKDLQLFCLMHNISSVEEISNALFWLERFRFRITPPMVDAVRAIEAREARESTE